MTDFCTFGSREAVQATSTMTHWAYVLLDDSNPHLNNNNHPVVGSFLCQSHFTWAPTQSRLCKVVSFKHWISAVRKKLQAEAENPEG